MRPLHICHVVLSLEPGGLENGVVNVVNGLDATRFRSSICCLRRIGEFASRIRPDVSIRAMDIHGGNDPRGVLRLRSLFRKWEVDIVHTRNAESFFYGVLGARLAGIPVVIHSEHGRSFPERRLRAAAQRLLLRSTDAAFTVSERLREDLVRELRLPRDRFEVLHNGVDVTRFRSTGSPSRRHLASRSLRIGSVGRLVAVKNYPLLLSAFARLPHHWNCQLVLIGEGPERASLTRFAAELGISDRVQFAGHRDDVPEFLRSLDVFVLPSMSEGMSNTLLEAMAAEVPVLASDVGGNREIIEPERSGLLFRAGDVEHAAAQLLRLIPNESLRQHLAAQGAARARSEFSMNAMLARYESLYSRTWSEKYADAAP